MQASSVPPAALPTAALPAALRAAAAALLLTAALVLAACESSPPAPAQQQLQPQPQTIVPVPQQLPPLTPDDVGSHLEATDWVAGVADWVSSMPDPTLAALTRRALWNDGRIFVPADGATGESFWLHIFTDISPESAQAWVRYLAAQPPDTALAFTSPEHALVNAIPFDPPAVGSAALAVRLLHGNAGARYRTEIIVFSQGAAVIFLRSSRREHLPAQTDLPAIARLLTQRLPNPP